ncbi:hypothetical protein [Desulfonema magnum]|uniref:Thioesterase n=1 Tax=Desulfonema magnum TaxID=45655 RepID=A0A975GQF2_9BACT|nr:hypothetical protein [Desulfonema magnum]QTA89817.1 Uncharacterized protein dnm_058740 [Desulfonema magnum]
MLIRHETLIHYDLCGEPVSLEEDFSRAEFVTTENMAADKSGLVHGGFISGLAD